MDDLLIDQAGAATASVITYKMPAVALFLGAGLPGELEGVAWLGRRLTGQTPRTSTTQHG